MGTTTSSDKATQPLVPEHVNYKRCISSHSANPMYPLPQLTSSTIQVSKWGTLTQWNFQQVSRDKQLSRLFVVFVPHSVEGCSHKLPVVCLFPGTNHQAWNTQLLCHHESNNGPLPLDRQTWLALAEEEGFLVVIAEARERQRNTCVEHQWKNDNTDVEYVDTMISFLGHTFRADLDKIYGLGFSQGGLYMSTLAIFRANYFAGLCNYMGGLTRIMDWFQEEDKIMLRSKLPNIEDVDKQIPFLVITSDADTNRAECLFAFDEFKRVGWDVKMIDVEGVSHQYLGEHTKLIWEFFKNPTLEEIEKNVKDIQVIRPSTLK